MKIFLTGQKQIGKSTCIKTFLERNHIPSCGFYTLPVYKEGKRIGFCMHALVDMPENDRVFSIQHDTYNEVIAGSFDDFGCRVLKESMRFPERMLILDEIGILEKDETFYLKQLRDAITLHPNVIGVIKKKKAAHNSWLWNHPQIRIIDMDEVSFEETLAILEKCLFEG